MAKKVTPPPVRPHRSLSWGTIAIFVLFVLAVGLYAYNRNKDDAGESKAAMSPSAEKTTPSQTSQSTGDEEETHSTKEEYRIPPYFEDPGAAGVLLPTKDPSIVTPYAQAGYVVAQKDPALLAQLPCFCYCDRFGHKSLHDCYVTDHAESCDVCLKEAIEAEQMKNQGMTAQEIRSVIIAKYHPRNHGLEEHAE
jgi:Protein of unknown function with PCYCGC motif